MMGMDNLLKTIVEQLPPETKAAIDAVPKNVETIARSLESINHRLGVLEAQRLCGRLESIETSLANLERISDDILFKVKKLDPSYTPDDPLPTLATLMHDAPDPTEPEPETIEVSSGPETNPNQAWIDAGRPNLPVNFSSELESVEQIVHTPEP